MKNTRVIAFVKNHQEIASGQTLILYGVNSNDILHLLNEDENRIEKWDLSYHAKVQNVITKIGKLFIR